MLPSSLSPYLPPFLSPHTHSIYPSSVSLLPFVSLPFLTHSLYPSILCLCLTHSTWSGGPGSVALPSVPGGRSYCLGPAAGSLLLFHLYWGCRCRAHQSHSGDTTGTLTLLLYIGAVCRISVCTILHRDSGTTSVCAVCSGIHE